MFTHGGLVIQAGRPSSEFITCRAGSQSLSRCLTTAIIIVIAIAIITIITTATIIIFIIIVIPLIHLL